MLFQVLENPTGANKKPEEVIAFLNDLTDQAPRGDGEFFWTISIQFCVPALVRPHELDAFVQYAKETTVIQGGSSSVKALTGSTEEEQFH